MTKHKSYKIGVIGGAGYVGLVTSVGLASIGHNVLSQDLEYYFENESSSILAAVTIFINDAVQFIGSFLQASASFAVIVFISLGLLFTNFFVAIISIVLFLPIYFLHYFPSIFHYAGGGAHYAYNEKCSGKLPLGLNQ